LCVWSVTAKVRIVAEDPLKRENGPGPLYEVLRDHAGDELEAVTEHRIATEADVHALVDSAFDAAELVSVFWVDETGYPNLVNVVLTNYGLLVQSSGRLRRYALYKFTDPNDLVLESRVSGDRFTSIDIDITYQRAP